MVLVERRQNELEDIGILISVVATFLYVYQEIRPTHIICNVNMQLTPAAVQLSFNMKTDD